MTEAGSIHIRGLHKSFRKYHASTLKDSLIQLARGRTLWERRPVLKGVDLDINAGERFGIVGRNGAGKSTLFKLMSGIMVAEEGTIDVGGRVSPLIEVTAGLVPDMSGYENLRLNAALHGLVGDDVDAQLEAMIAFSELEDFMDTPVRYFSSGMQARLGFAIASHIEAEVLLIDEVLAVGDVDFRARCMARLTDLSAAGRTVVFVSHDFERVQRFCDRVAWLEDGVIQACGAPDEVLEQAREQIGARRR